MRTCKSWQSGVYSSAPCCGRRVPSKPHTSIRGRAERETGSTDSPLGHGTGHDSDAPHYVQCEETIELCTAGGAVIV